MVLFKKNRFFATFWNYAVFSTVFAGVIVLSVYLSERNLICVRLLEQ